MPEDEAADSSGTDAELPYFRSDNSSVLGLPESPILLDRSGWEELEAGLAVEIGVRPSSIVGAGEACIVDGVRLIESELDDFSIELRCSRIGKLELAVSVELDCWPIDTNACSLLGVIDDGREDLEVLGVIEPAAEEESDGLSSRATELISACARLIKRWRSATGKSSPSDFSNSPSKF